MPSGSAASPGSTNPIIRPFASMPFESTWPRTRSWSADATVFGSSGKNVTPVKPSARSSSSRAALAPASSWCAPSKCVSSASIASSRTEIPRSLMSGRPPDGRGRVSTSAGESGANLTVSPSGWGPLRGRSG